MGIEPAPENKHTRCKIVLNRRKEAMLVELRRLCAAPRNGIPLSARQIARECDCDKQHIVNIERAALRKMLKRLPKEVRDAFDTLISQGRETGRSKTNTPYETV